jgi:hypothetical protein
MPSPLPLWQFDLRSVGYTGFEPPKHERTGLTFKPELLCFTENSTLAANFITRSDVTTLTRRDGPGESLPLRLHAVFLDSTAGTVRASREWPITRPEGWVAAAGDGKFVVIAPASLSLYSPAFELQQRFLLSTSQQATVRNFHTSPGGQSILAEYRTKHQHSSQWIDVATMKPAFTWDVLFPWVSISDGEFATSKESYTEANGVVAEVSVHTPEGDSRTVCRSRLGHGLGCGSPFFISNRLLVLWRAHAFSLISTTDGEPILQDNVQNDEWFGWPAHPSSNGNRFAATVWVHKGENAFLDLDYKSVLKRIVVYDIPGQRLIYTLDFGKKNISSAIGIAISPDGAQIAVLVDGIVSAYQLPANSPTPLPR